MSQSPLHISRSFITAMGTRMFVCHQDRIPMDSPLLVISNHRSFMDAFVLMAAIERPIRFACHHYMGQVPVMRDLVSAMGCFPLAAPESRQQSFLHQGSRLLQCQQAVGIFPEGAQPMVRSTHPWEVGSFHRGFAHLALRSAARNLAVLPVALASTDETTYNALPVKLLSIFDPSEPLFNAWSWHPMVLYHRLSVAIGRPYWITPSARQAYQGRQAKTAIAKLVDHCQMEITTLLQQEFKVVTGNR